MASDPTYQPKVHRRQGGNILAVESGGEIQVLSGGSVTGNQVRHTAVSQVFNLDNGAGTTVDDVIIKPSSAITITRAQIVYVGATTGTVAAGNAKLGTTIGGAEIAAAVAYGNGAVIGAATGLPLTTGAVAANQAVHVRHTGVAATAAGEAYVEIEYTINA